MTALKIAVEFCETRDEKKRSNSTVKDGLGVIELLLLKKLN